MTPRDKSPLRKFIVQTLATQDTDLADLLTEVLEGDRSAEDVAYTIRRRTGVEVSGATVRRWAIRLREGS